MPRRRPECGAARAVGGTGPGGPVRQPELQRYRGAGARREAGSPKRGGKPGLRSEAGSRAADARNATQTRAARSEEGGIRTALHERAAKQETQKGLKGGRTCRRGNCSKAHVPQPQKSPQKSTRSRRDARWTGCGCRSRRGARRKAHAAAVTRAGQGADAGVAEGPAEKHTQPQKSPQDRARMPKPPRSPPKPRKRPGRPLAPEGRPSPQRAMQNENRIRAAGRLPPDFRPTSARLSQGAQEPHREHRTAQTAPPEKIRARGFTASGSSVRLVRLMRVGESHVSIHKDNSGLR